MGYSLLESANRFMGKSAYEQEELEAKAKIEEMDDEETTIVIGGEEEGDLEGGEDLEGLEDLDGEEGEEELPLMPIEAAIRAIQLALNGEVESAEEALDLVQDLAAEDGEDEELEGGELEGELEIGGEEEVEECSSKLEGDKEVVEEEEEVVDETTVEIEVEDDEEEEEEEKVYGESHSKFLRLSARYL